MAVPVAPSVARWNPAATYWPNSVTVAFSVPSVIVRIPLVFALFSAKDSFSDAANLYDDRSSVSPAANPETVGAIPVVLAIDSLPCVPGENVTAPPILPPDETISVPPESTVALAVAPDDTVSVTPLPTFNPVTFTPGAMPSSPPLPMTAPTTVPPS